MMHMSAQLTRASGCAPKIAFASIWRCNALQCVGTNTVTMPMSLLV